MQLADNRETASEAKNAVEFQTSSGVSWKQTINAMRMHIQSFQVTERDRVPLTALQIVHSYLSQLPKKNQIPNSSGFGLNTEFATEVWGGYDIIHDIIYDSGYEIGYDIRDL